MATELHTLVVKAMAAIASLCRDTMSAAHEESGLETTVFVPLWVTHNAEPERLVLHEFQHYSPYSSTRRLEEGLMEAVRQGFLTEPSKGEYRLTEEGREMVRRTLERGFYGPLAAADHPLPSAALKRLAELLRRVTESATDAPEPSTKYWIQQNRRKDPGGDAPLMIQVDQYLTDLFYFRDDAHLAAWQPHGITGPAWEALTQLWQGESLSALQQNFAQRGHPESRLVEALQELAGRGWVAQDGDSTTITDAGRVLRQKAEEETDRLYNAPWACLDKTEMEELETLLTQFCDGLTRKDAD